MLKLKQIDGTVLAPPKVGSWPKSSLFQWINFKWVQNFTIKGTGIVDGQGYSWWKYSSQQIYNTQVSPINPNHIMNLFSSTAFKFSPF